MEPKATTMIERLGFRDPDRKNPNHDEIQLWVYANFKLIMKSTFPNVNFDDIDFALQLEYAIMERNFIVGFIDIFCARYSIAVEVKTSIPSVGELLRQIHFYRKFLCGQYWIVVSPDDSARDILTKQGLYFFKYMRPVRPGQLKLF